MLSLVVFLPALAAAVLGLARGLPDRVARWAWVLVAAVETVLVLGLWLAFEDPGRGRLAFEEQVRWLPSLGSSYHVGLDGLSLPLVLMTNVVFLACAVHALTERRRPRAQAALFLFLQATCLGVFAAADLLVFFVFFDLSIVGMYAVIAGWGHRDAARSALKFFLYTFLGSLVLLLGFIGLFAASGDAGPRTFDMVELAARPPLVDRPLAGGLVLVAVLVGLAVKIPTVPFHTWLPPAHTDAPAVGSAVLAGVLLKLGTYGLVRIAVPMLPEAWRSLAWVVVALGVVSVLWGALVALAQTDVKRMIAYTSVNHMGYVVLGLGVAGLLADGAPDASREEAAVTAVSGALTQMVSHGLITAALFLLVDLLWQQREDYSLDAYGGLARVAPVFSGLFAVGAFASLGLPGFSGFVAEVQVFAGSIALAPVTAVALLGILLTAALYLRALQRLVVGPVAGRSVGLADLAPHATVAVAGLLALSVLVGLLPAVLLDVVAPAAQHVVDALSGADLP
ncbi:NADH-quinone oxidoreductase subunit M [Aquipuribacter nitratireducens]|uniref:NuoM family protein n=1 Tax=Aquipuribacter nitratireducens TaxID=650104 RepID=A0ABW0GPV3_9MICO